MGMIDKQLRVAKAKIEMLEVQNETSMKESISRSLNKRSLLKESNCYNKILKR
jgi:hypothetical protein